MKRFLRLFRDFRDAERSSLDLSAVRGEVSLLRQAVLDLEKQRDVLQDRAAHTEAENQHLWAELSRALEGERKALQMGYNEHWKIRYGTTPYPEAPFPPDRAAPDTEAAKEGFGRINMLPSQAAQAQAIRNIRTFVDSQRQKA
jgi:hypothetical protein